MRHVLSTYIHIRGVEALGAQFPSLLYRPMSSTKGYQRFGRTHFNLAAAGLHPDTMLFSLTAACLHMEMALPRLAAAGQHTEASLVSLAEQAATPPAPASCKALQLYMWQTRLSENVTPSQLHQPIHQRASNCLVLLIEIAPRADW